MENIEKVSKIDWHPGFYGGLEFVLRDYKKLLTFDREHVLSKQSTVMDMLIIKKESDEKINSPIGRIFRRFNIVEYKSPKAGLTIDDVYKVVSYAGLYKAHGDRVNAVPVEDMSISIFRHTYPRMLFKALDEMPSVRVDEKFSGIYYVSGIINIPLQIVITKELDERSYGALRVLSVDASKDDIKNFIEETKLLVDKDDKINADAILQVSISANRDLYEVVRRENTMCQALRDLMKDEIDKELSDNEANTLKGVAEDMLRDNEPIEKISKYSRLSQDEIVELAESIGIEVIY